MPHSTTRETPLKMVHGSDAVILVEIGQPSWWVMYPSEDNEQLLGENLDMVDKVREIAKVKEFSQKQ
jgi:hypothetical protein